LRYLLTILLLGSLAYGQAARSDSVAQTTRFTAGGSHFSGSPIVSSGSTSNNQTVPGTMYLCAANGYKYVDVANTCGWSGTDIGSWINSAYAAITSNGGTIIVNTTGGANFSTPIRMTTSGKFARIVCTDQNSALNYIPTSGTAITLNPSNAIYVGWGLENCNFVGPGSGTSTTGLSVGGSNGAIGAEIDHNRILNFGTGITFGSNAFLDNFFHNFVANNGKDLNIPSGLTGTGESIVFDATTFAQTASYVPNCATVDIGAAPNILFANGSFDNCQYEQSGGGTSVSMEGMHFENPAQPGTNPFIIMSGGSLSLVSPDFGATNSGRVPVPTSFISESGGRLSMNNGRVLNLSSNAIGQVVALTRTAEFHESGTRNDSGSAITSLWSYGGTGCASASGNTFALNKSIACGPFRITVVPAIGNIGSLPGCSSSLEGTHAVANDCNAWCSVGGTCTGGGSTHCEVYCNGASYFETGR